MFGDPDDDVVDDDENLNPDPDDDSDEPEEGGEPDGDQPDPDSEDDESDETGEDPELESGASSRSTSEDEENDEGESNTKLKRRFHYAMQDNEKLRRENEELRAKAEKPEPELVEPKRDEFEDVDEYIDAREKYVTEKTRREERAKVQEDDARRAEEKHLNTVQQNWEDQLADGRAKYKDFDDAHITSDLQQTTGPMAQFLMESDIGGELSYQLFKNPDKYGVTFEGMSELSVPKQFAKMARIEDKVRAKMTDKPNKQTPVSGAPEPTPKPKPKSTPDDSPNDKDSTGDYIAKRRKERYGSGRRHGI